MLALVLGFAAAAFLGAAFLVAVVVLGAAFLVVVVFLVAVLAAAAFYTDVRDQGIVNGRGRAAYLDGGFGGRLTSLLLREFHGARGA